MSIRTLHGLAGLSFFGSVATASAADIASVLGNADPADPTWAASCPGGNLPAAGSDGLLACIPLLEPLCLHRVDIDISGAGFPNATCSDGTAGSFYIREASDVDDVDRWVIHLQGGGGCMDEAGCQARWCGDDGLYTAALMSNDWDADGVIDRPEHAWVNGISANLPANDFATWNHVYVPYCSSDGWLGRASDVDLGAFDVDAHGHTILYAVRNMLRKLGANPNWTATDGGYTISDLDDAAEILFTGTSAGGYGALQNGDWFLDKFPAARTGLVVDAAIDLDPQVVSLYNLWDSASAQPYASRRLELWGERWEPGGYWNAIDGFIDEDCRDVYESNDDLAVCMSSSWLLRLAYGSVPIITTPTFLRMDLEDPALSQWIIGPNPDGDEVTIGNGGPTPTLQQYTEMIRETMVRLAADGETEISVHAPRCGQHVGLEHIAAFSSWDTDDTSDPPPPPARTGRGVAKTFRDALWLWFDPGGAFDDDRRIDSDEPGVDFSSCTP
jgi:Pectinacetylesterase